MFTKIEEILSAYKQMIANHKSMRREHHDKWAYHNSHAHPRLFGEQVEINDDASRLIAIAEVLGLSQEEFDEIWNSIGD